MTVDPTGEPFRLESKVRQELPSDVDPDRLEAFLAQSPTEDRTFYLELALGPRARFSRSPYEVSGPEAVTFIERADRPRGLEFGDPERQALWRAVFRHAV